MMNRTLLIRFLGIAVMLLGSAVTSDADGLNVSQDPPPPPIVAVVDARAEALLKMADSTAQKLRSVAGEEEIIDQIQMAGRSKSEYRYLFAERMLKPNFSYGEYTTLLSNKNTGAWDRGHSTISAADGRTFTELLTPTRYKRQPAAPDGSNIGVSSIAVPGFFSPAHDYMAQIRDLRAKGQLVSLRYAGEESWQDIPCDAVLYEVKGLNVDGDAFTKSVRLTLSRRDHLVHHYLTEWACNGNHIHGERIMRSLQLNAPLKPSDFAYTPPAAAKPEPPPAPALPLLAQGTDAPDFTVFMREGKPRKLSDFRGKIVVLDFWATWCPPCLESLPHTNALTAQIQAQNVVTLAVDVGDPRKTFDDWLLAHRDLEALTFALTANNGEPEESRRLSSLYHVSGIPTQYIIDAHGKIVDALDGYGGKTDHRLETALQKAGISLPSR